jgi:hypothetical protein
MAEMFCVHAGSKKGLLAANNKEKTAGISMPIFPVV